MNISVVNLRKQNSGMGLSLFSQGMSKSERDRLARQEKANSQIAFWEERKASLKNMECDTVEDIKRKLEEFHSYEDEIKAAKMAYNYEQMWHTMDEAKEQGEKIAKAIEKSEPKTAEERARDLAEEVLDPEGGDGVLEELMDELTEAVEAMEEKRLEEAVEDAKELAENIEERSLEQTAEEILKKAMEDPLKQLMEEPMPIKHFSALV